MLTERAADRRRRRLRAALPAIAVAAFALVLYAWRLDFSPPFLADDEVVFALQAHSIATTAHDLSGRLLPLYFQMGPLGETSWFHPALVYFSVPFEWLLPFTEATVRFPTAVVGAICVLLTFFIARRVFDDARLAVAAAALLAFTPAEFMLSRMTADYIYPVPFVLGWLLALLVYLDTGRRRHLLAATMCLGFGVYTYIASVIMMPVYLLITLATLVARRRDPLREAAVAIGGFVLPLLLIPSWLAFHPQVVTETLARYGQTAPVPVGELTRGLSLDDALRELRRPVHFSGVIRRISLYWYFFDPAYLFVTGGYANPINSTRHVGVFLWPLFVLVPIGAWRIATTPSALGRRLIVAGFLTAPVAAVFVPEPYAVDREAALMAFGALLAAAGLDALAATARPRLRLAVWALLLLIPLQFAGFLFDYFTAYRGQAGFWFGYNHRGAVEAVIERADDRVPAIYLTTAHDPVIDAYWRFGLIKYHREDLLGRTRHYDPETLDASTIPPGSLLIALAEERAMARRVADGELRRILDVPEIADPPKFSVLQR